jgi:hypothetical protein
MSTAQKWIAWTVGVIVLLAATITGLIAAGRSRANPWPERLSHVRLEPTRPILRESDVTPDNAFFYLRQLTQPDDEMRKAWSEEEWVRFSACGWSDGNFPALQASVEAFSNALALVDQAVSLPNCQMATIDDFMTPMPYVSSILRMSRLSIVMAERSAAKGRWDEAEKIYRRGLIASDYISRGGPLIGHLVNYAGISTLCGSLRRVVLEGDPPPRFLEDMIVFLDGLDRNAEPFAEAIRYEYLGFQSVLPMVFSDFGSLISLTDGETVSRPPIHFLKWPIIFLTGSSLDRMQRDSAAVYSHLVDIASTTHEDGRSIDGNLPGFGREPGLLVRIGEFTDNGLGRVLVQLLAPALGQARSRWFLSRVDLRATRAVLAVKLWKMKHGRWPESLEQLVPDFLPTVPDDPFTRAPEPLKYARDDDHFIVYSVGADGMDEGGRHQWDQERPSIMKADACFGSEEFGIRCRRWMTQAKQEQD